MSAKNVLPRVKVHLLRGRTLTGLEALQKFGTMRLAEYVRVLRHEHGMNIQTRMIERNGKRIGEYYLPIRKKQKRN